MGSPNYRRAMTTVAELVARTPDDHTACVSKTPVELA